MNTASSCGCKSDINKHEIVQRRTTETVGRLKYFSCEEGLREQGCFNLEQGQLQVSQHDLPMTTERSLNIRSQAFHRSAQWKDNKQLISFSRRKVQSGYKEKRFTMKTVRQWKKFCRESVSILGGFQDSTG